MFLMIVMMCNVSARCDVTALSFLFSRRCHFCGIAISFPMRRVVPFQDFELTVQQVEESMMFQIHNGTFFVGNIPGDYEVGDMWEEVRRWGLKDTVPLITKPWRNGTSEETSFFVLCIHASPNHRASPLVREHKSCFLSFSLSLSLSLSFCLLSVCHSACGLQFHHTSVTFARSFAPHFLFKVSCHLFQGAFPFIFHMAVVGAAGLHGARDSERCVGALAQEHVPRIQIRHRQSCGIQATLRGQLRCHFEAVAISF